MLPNLAHTDFQDSAVHIRDEHLTASQGAYMEFVEGVQEGDDREEDDHEKDPSTEVCRDLSVFMRAGY